MSEFLFPTSQWLEEYQRALNESGALSDIGADWGVGFDGGVVIAITDLPLAETAVLDLPERVIEDIPDAVLADIGDVPLTEAPSLFSGRARETLPEIAADLLDQLEYTVHDGTVYAYVEIVQGECTDIEVLDGPDARPAGTTVAATCATWQQIIEGRPVVSALMSGDLKIASDGWQGLAYPLVLQSLGDVAADVETTHIFAEPDTSFADFVMDTTVRQPVTLQKVATRQVAFASKMFGVF